MSNLVLKLPLLTTIAAFAFTRVLYRQWSRQHRPLYLGWWTAGMFFYGLGALTESITSLFGWHETVFRAWYIFGAICGAAPLAQGTVYLLLSRQVGNRLSAMLLGTMAIASVCALKSPVNYMLVDSYRLSGAVFEWQWLRGFSPLINFYALFVLAGGALWSAWRYWMETDSRARMVGNILIACAVVLPAIGGGYAKRGHIGWLYVTELLAVLLIWRGYNLIQSDPTPSIHHGPGSGEPKNAAAFT